MDDIAQQWAGDPSVTEMTDTDLTASRSDNTNVSDPTLKLHRLAQTVRDAHDYPDISWTLDTALRVELARLIDDEEVWFGRDDFDVRYTIPQEDWVIEQEFDELSIVSRSELAVTDRGLNFSAPPVVLRMAESVVEQGFYDTLSETVIAGLQVIANCQDFQLKASVTRSGVNETQRSPELKIAVTQLFQTETQRQIIRWALQKTKNEKWYRTGEIADAVGKDKNDSVSNVVQPKEGVIGPMIRFGILEPKHNPVNMPNIPHYRPAETQVIELLEQWDTYPLRDLFASKTAQRLSAFFIFEGDDQRWSVNQIRHEGPFGHEAVDNNIGKLVDAGLLTTEDTPRTTAYRLNTDSDMYHFLGELNKAILEIADKHKGYI